MPEPSLNSDGHLEKETVVLDNESSALHGRVIAGAKESKPFFPTQAEGAESITRKASALRAARKVVRTQRPAIPKGFLFRTNSDTQVSNFQGSICTQRDIYR